MATTFSEPRLVRGKDLREAAVIAFAVLLMKTCPVLPAQRHTLRQARHELPRTVSLAAVITWWSDGHRL